LCAERGLRLSTRRKNLVPLFGVAFIVAIISTGIFYGLFVGRLNSATPSTAVGSIVIAAKAIPAGTVVAAAQLRSAPWSVMPLPNGAVSKIEDVIGKTVVSPVAENEMLTRSHIGAESGGSVDGGSMGIPDGMRAVSVTVQDSAGVVALLKPGHRVDVQVIGTMQGSPSHEPQLRTMLENMQVLTIPRDQVGARAGAHTVTLLATPREAAALGLADSTAKIRLVLRNPVDQRKDNLASVGLGSVFRQGPMVSTASPVSPARSNATRSVPASQQVQFLVRVAGLGSEASKEIASYLDAPSPDSGSLQVAAFRTGGSLEKAIERMQHSKSMELLTTSQLLTSQKQEAGAHWSLDSKATGSGLRIQLAPSIQSDGKVRLRVHPEVSTGGEKGISRRKVDTEIEVADGQSFIVRGFAEPASLGLLWDHLFPGKGNSDTRQDMVVMVTPRVIRVPAIVAAVPPTV
jgi:Flp pilus assembly protein CpaB